ncbi:serine/threonine protein kinase [Micromonospora sp. NPDC048063]|uniref:serine/threonine protein kinase n=1 Tax=Micromonospora sp. NPDC048063 TaxID=3364256 RepID=UPI003719B984
MMELPLDSAFAVFDAQGSGCVSYGVEASGRRWFVKTATTAQSRRSLLRAAQFHAAVRHPAIVRPEHVLDGPTLVYPWHNGSVLNHATTHGSDRSALHRFQQLPLRDVETAIDTILDAHLAITAAGYVAVDLYDGCFLYDFHARQLRLIDLDEYRPGPFTLDTDASPDPAATWPPKNSSAAPSSTSAPPSTPSAAPSTTSSTPHPAGAAPTTNNR